MPDLEIGTTSVRSTSALPFRLYAETQHRSCRPVKWELQIEEAPIS